VLVTIKRIAKLFLVFLAVILGYSFLSVPFLFLYAPEDVNAVPLISIFFYNKLEPKYDLINMYIESSVILSYLKYSELARSIYSIFTQGFLLLLPVAFYKKGSIKYYFARTKAIGTMDRRGKVLYSGVIFATVIFIIISSSASPAPQYFPSFNSGNIIFWVRYSFIICLFGPLGEELFFRGIVFDEIKDCYNLSPRLIIFYQTLVFFIFHLLFSSNISLVIFLIGIATGIFVFYTNSLLYSIIFHVCYNSFVFLCQVGIINISKYKISYFLLAFLLILFLLLIILFMRLFINHMKILLFLDENSNELCNATSKPGHGEKR
jgi:membrane protease YdiL (CAAX protease family)